MARRRRSNDSEEKDKEIKEEKEAVKDSASVKDPFSEIEIPKEMLVTAWYTPQIPVKNGPGEYTGLPRLILELNFYRTTILCSKIVMNPKDLPVIEAPSKGAVVTQDEFEVIVKEKTQEMRDNWRNRSGRRGRGE